MPPPPLSKLRGANGPAIVSLVSRDQPHSNPPGGAVDSPSSMELPNPLPIKRLPGNVWEAGGVMTTMSKGVTLAPVRERMAAFASEQKAGTSAEAQIACLADAMIKWWRRFLVMAKPSWGQKIKLCQCSKRKNVHGRSGLTDQFQ